MITLSRRDFLVRTGATALAVSVLPGLFGESPQAVAGGRTATTRGFRPAGGTLARALSVHAALTCLRRDPVTAVRYAKQLAEPQLKDDEPVQRVGIRLPMDRAGRDALVGHADPGIALGARIFHAVDAELPPPPADAAHPAGTCRDVAVLKHLLGKPGAAVTVEQMTGLFKAMTMRSMVLWHTLKPDDDAYDAWIEGCIDFWRDNRTQCERWAKAWCTPDAAAWKTHVTAPAIVHDADPVLTRVRALYKDPKHPFTVAAIRADAAESACGRAIRSAVIAAADAAAA